MPCSVQKGNARLKITRLFAIFLLLLLAACSTPETFASLPPTLTPSPQPLPPTATPNLVHPAQKVVEVSLSETSSLKANAEIAAGGTAHLRLSLAPVLLTIAPGSVSTRPWDDAGLKEMQVCFGLDQPCSLDAKPWTPYQAETLVEYPVDWLGSHWVWAEVRVRDVYGVLIRVFVRSSNTVYDTSPVEFEIVGQIDAAIPPEKQPTFVQTAIAATRTAFPLTGSVVIAGGKCCAGGEVGATITVPVTFAASSPTGTVTEMRVSRSGGCPKDATTLDAPWEPFAASKDFPINVVINWSTFSISVQYRDDGGNLSPIYCADIGLEGNPPMPTP
jgi:hypothetical protein